MAISVTFDNSIWFGAGLFDRPEEPSVGSLTTGAWHDRFHHPFAISWLATIEQSIGSRVISLARLYMAHLAGVSSALAMAPTICWSEPFELEIAPYAPPIPRDIAPVAGVLNRIEQLTGLAKVRIAEDLLGVSKVAYFDWLSGKSPSPANDARIRGTLDVLERAAKRHETPELLRGWLQTPRGARAVRPMTLLRDNHIEEARLLAISAAPANERPVPNWLMDTPVSQVTSRRRRRGIVTRDALDGEQLGYLDRSDDQ